MPETTENNHHIPVKDAEGFVEGSFRTIEITAGIKAVIGKLTSDPSGPTVIEKYIFDKEKFSMAEAEKWVSEHKRSSGMELRSCGKSDLRMTYEDNKPPTLIGYAVVYGELNTGQIAGDPRGVREKILPGAFSQCIKKDEIKCLAQHDPTKVLGRTRSGTLKLFEDERGVLFQCVPPKAQWADDLVTSVKRGDISEMSFGFKNWDIFWTNEDGMYVRNVKSARMSEISVVTDAAYGTSSVAVRNAGFTIIDGIVFDCTSEEKAAEQVKAEEERFKKLDDQFESFKKKLL